LHLAAAAWQCAPSMAMGVEMLTKLRVARCQLGTALDLFVRDADPVSVQTLTCAAMEILGEIAKGMNIDSFMPHALRTFPDMDIVELQRLQRKYCNAFKHLTYSTGKLRDDHALLAGFDDGKNDGSLFVAWYDYQAIEKRMPIAAQVFQVWWFALHEDSLAPDVDRTPFRDAFPNVVGRSRKEQKQMLVLAIKQHEDDIAISNHKLTEKLPLCLPSRDFNAP